MQPVLHSQNNPTALENCNTDGQCNELARPIMLWTAHKHMSAASLTSQGQRRG